MSPIISHLLFVVIMCQAAQMEFNSGTPESASHYHLLESELSKPVLVELAASEDSSTESTQEDSDQVVAPTELQVAQMVLQLNAVPTSFTTPALPKATARANFETHQASWGGMQLLALEDFDVDGKKHKYVDCRDHAAFPAFVTGQQQVLSAFALAHSLEDRMSLVLQSFADFSVFMNHFQGAIGGDEKFVIMMYLFAQTVPGAPGLRQAGRKFSEDFETVYQAFQTSSYETLDFDVRAVRFPAIFSPSQRDPLGYMEIVRIHNHALAKIAKLMTNHHVEILNNFRDRMVQMKLVEEVLALYVPDTLVRATTQLSDWEQELQLLKDFQVVNVFAAVFDARGVFTKDVALQSFVWFLVDPTHLQGDQAELHRIFDAHDAMWLRQQSENYRNELLQLFIKLALRIAIVDEGRFLAGLVHAIWMTRGDNLQSMWNRNLYKRSFKRWAIISWRQWIQEELLSRNNNELDTKEIVKSTVEKVTGILRTAPKKSWAATDMADALFNYFNV